MLLKAFLMLSFMTLATKCGKLDNLKLCVVGDPKLKVTHNTKYCDFLEKSKGSPVACVYEPDRLGCLSAVANKKADFSIFEVEELYVSAEMNQNLVLVVGEIRDLKEKSYHYGTVVVVRKSSNITSIKDLRGKRLCHPGLENGSEWPYIFAQYFEERIAPMNCEEGITLYEDRIKSTSEFFESACMAGIWDMNPKEDARLKKKYWNLCALCESGDCRMTEKYRGSGGSITCFKDGVGDLLWGKYEDVKVHIGSGDIAESDYSFLCEDGTSVPFSANSPCIWLARPWQVVIANRKSTINVQKILDRLGGDNLSAWEINLLHLVEIYMQYIQNLPVARTPQDYLQSIPGYLSASAMSEGNCKPKRLVKLCVCSSMDYLKCSWMSKAAAAFAVQPSVECVQKSNITSCLDSVSKMETDVVIVPADYLREAVVNFNLETFLVESGDHFNDSSLISALVNADSSTLLWDLKGKRACFPKADGFALNGVIEVLHQNNFINSKSGYNVQHLYDFFGEICVVDYGGQKYNLKKCCPDLSNYNNADAKTLACLHAKGCDVAFVDTKNAQDWKSVTNEFKTICPNEESIDCVWTWSHPNYLMTYPEISPVKAEEAFNVFFRLGQYFGRNSKRNTAMFKIFGPFKQNNNILFKDTSSSFVFLHHWNHTNDYYEIVEKMKGCSTCLMFSNWSLFLLLLILFLFN